MIEFGTLKIKNFMSIGEAEISLKRGGFTLISAENHRVEDAAQSNGSGKSTISESMVWALTGETIRGHKEVVNRYTEGDCEVELTLSFKGHKWAIKRTMSRSKEKSLTIIKDGQVLPAKGYRDAVDVLNRELPELNFKFINSVIILGQGLPGRFTNNSPAGRKAVLEELTNADFMIAQIKENISRRKMDLSGQLREAEDKRLSLTSVKSRVNDEIVKGKASLLELQSFDLQSETLELERLAKEGSEQKNKVEHLQLTYDQDKTGVTTQEFERQRTITSYFQKIVDVESSIKAKKKEEENRINLEVSKRKSELNEWFLKETAEIDTNCSKKISEATVKSYALIDKYKSELVKARENLRVVLATLNGGRCPTCGQTMPGITPETLELANSDKLKFETEVADLEKKISEENDNIASITLGMERKAHDAKGAIILRRDEQIEAIRAYEQDEVKTLIKFDEELKAKKGQLTEEQMAAVDQIDKGLKELKDKLAISKSEYEEGSKLLEKLREDYRSKKSAIEAYNSKIEFITNNLKEAGEKLIGIDKGIDEANDTIDNLTKRLEIVKKMETFAQRDFRGILLESVIARLDQILKGYSQLVYGNQLTRFYQDGNAIVVEFDGKEYESLSGGEQQKINVLLQLSLRDLIIELTGTTGSFILLDEVFDGLDYHGCEKMINLFQNLETSVFIITHHQELDIPYDYEIRVIKEADGVAHIEVA